MKDIRIYDLNFRLLAIEPFYFSFHYTEKLRGIGNFEIHLKKDSDLLKLSLPCLVEMGNFHGIATGLQVSSEGIIYGRTLNFLLSKRICRPFDCSGMDGGEILSAVTEKYLSDFALCASAEFTPPEGFAIAKADTVSSVLTKLCGDGGYELTADFGLGKYVLKYVPVHENPYPFSESSGFADNVVMGVNYAGYANFTTFGDEIISAAEAEGAYRWEALPEGDSDSEVLTNLKGFTPDFTVTAKLTAPGYKQDYFLGDLFLTDDGRQVMLSEISADIDENGENLEPKLEIAGLRE